MRERRSEPGARAKARGGGEKQFALSLIFSLGPAARGLPPPVAAWRGVACITAGTLHSAGGRRRDWPAPVRQPPFPAAPTHAHFTPPPPSPLPVPPSPLNPGHTAGVSAVRWSPDGSRLASASGDGTARIWDGATGACLAVLAGGHEPRAPGLNDVAWSPDGAHVASAGDDGTARLWGVDAAIAAAAAGAPAPKPVKTLRGHTSYVFAVAFNPRKSEVVSFFVPVLV